MKSIGIKFILLILAALVVLATVYFLLKDKAKVEQQQQQEQQQGQSMDANQVQQRIDYVRQNIAELSPAEPVLGGSWLVTRFWFADANNFYVEYEDGHILRQILVNYDGSNYQVVGYFEPGENMFELKEGQDKIFGEDVVLYEYDQETESWTKK